MLKLNIITIFSIFMLNVGLKNMSNEEKKSSEVCRITCTIQVSDGFGGTIGITATAGNIFTSCETAGARACRKASRKANAILEEIFGN